MQVNNLITKPQTPLPSGKLQYHTSLHPQIRNETKSSNTFNMLSRHPNQRDFVINLVDLKIDTLFLNPSVEHCVDKLVIRLSNFTKHS